MTERKVKRDFIAFVVKTSSSYSEKNEERLNDSDEQTALSSSRKTFIRNALCLFLIITASNDAIDETQRPKNHASLLSFERFTIIESIWFDSCVIFQLWKYHFFEKSQKIVFFRLRPYFWNINSELIFLNKIFLIKKSDEKFDKKKFFLILASVKFESVDEKVFDCKKLMTFFKRHIVSSSSTSLWVAYVNTIRQQTNLTVV